MATSNTTELSLSHIALYGRKFLLWGGAFLIFLIVGRTLLTTLYQTYKALNPPPPPAATFGFGLLPAPPFPQQVASDRPKTYVLDTVGKQLPYYGTTVPVYFMPEAQPNLLALDEAKAQAAALGFVFQPEKISSDVYRWRRTVPLPATLEMNIVHKTLDLTVDWSSSVTLLEKKMIPTPQQLTLETRTLLRTANMLASDVATASPQITYVQALAGQLREVSSLSEADFVRVDVFRTVPGGIPTVTAEKDQGIIRILYSGSRDQGERVLSLRSRYYPVNWANPETYPLQGSDLAYQSLQAGGGYVISPALGDTATIRQVSLAYFEPPAPFSYLHPVYVFDGDDGFRAVVSALDPRSFAAAEAN